MRKRRQLQGLVPKLPLWISRRDKEEQGCQGYPRTCVHPPLKFRENQTCTKRGYHFVSPLLPRFPKGQKKHINFFNINFLDPARNPPFWAPRKKLCASFPGKGRQNWTHINSFRGILGVKNGVPNGPFSATKSLVYCFFPALIP